MAAAAVISTALPQLAYAAPPSNDDTDSGGGIVDAVKGWFTDDDSETPEPPSHDEADIADRQKLPKGKNAPQAKRIKELTGRRTADARFWQLSDGRVQAEVSATPTAYRSGKSWKDIDPTVGASDRKGYAFANTSNATRSWFGADAERLLRVESADGHAVTVGLPRAGELRPVAEGDVVTYQDAVSGADLSYQVGPGRVKENIVLDRAPDGPLTFTFTLDTDGLTPKAAKDGSIAFYGESTDPVLVMPAAFMTDAKKDRESPYGTAYSTAVRQRLTRDGDGWKLTVVPDAAWLAAKDRQYPVVIDPTIQIAPTPSTAQDVMISSDGPASNYDDNWRLSVGNTSTGSSRALLRFPVGSIPAGTRLDSADLRLYYDQTHTTGSTEVQLEAHRATGAWTESGATWDNASGLTGELSGTSVVVDDGDTGTTAATGSWPASGNTAYTQYAVGQDYRYNKDSVAADAYTWQPSLPEDGDYQVEAHYVPASDRATNAPYTVTYDGGSQTYSVDQSAGSQGVWKTLGTHPFQAGTAGKVVLGDGPASTSTAVIADAVRFTKGGVVTKRPSQVNAWHSFPVTKTVQQWIDGTYDNHGFVVKAGDESASGPKGGPRYEGSEYAYNGETANYPRLVLTYGRPGVELEPPATIHDTGAELSWSAYTDPSTTTTDDDLVEYQVHRSVFQTFTPSAATLVAPVSSGTTSYTDTSATPTAADSADPFGRAYYYMVAVKTRDGRVTPAPTQLVRLPKAGRTTKVVWAAQDTTLSSAEPSTPHDSLEDGIAQPWMTVGNNSTTYGTTRAALKFPALDIPSSARVLNATVRLWGTQTTTGASGAVYEMRPLTRDFDEATATWTKADATTGWTTAGGDFGTAVSDTAPSRSNDPSRQDWSATSLVQDWVRNPGGGQGVLLKMRDESVQQERTVFLSSEAAEQQLRPRTVVTYIDSTTASTYHAPKTPARMTPNSDYSVEFTLTNTTDTVWRAADQALSYTWSLPDGTDATTGGIQVRTALPRDVVPGDTVTVQALVKTPINSDSGNKRTEYVLTWDLLDTTTGTWLSEGTGGIPGLQQNVAVEDPTSNTLGLEKFYAYTGKNTGAGSTVMNNVAAGNSVWSYNAINNPGRGVNTFFRVAYNSLDTSDTVLGGGWSGQATGPLRLGAPLDFHPNPNPTEVRLPDGDGTTHVFRKQTDGTWKAPAGVHYRLTAQPGLDCTPDKDPVPDAWTLLRPDGTRFLFGCDGYLTSVVDNDGNTQTYTYEERRSNNKPTKFLTYITDPTGRQSLTFAYYRKGDASYDYIDDTGAKVTGSHLTNSRIYDHIKSVTDVSGRRITFYYTDKGLLGQLIDGEDASQPKVFTFTYDATQGNKNVKLVEATDPRGNATRLTYYYPQTGDDPKYHWWTKTINDRLGHDTGFGYAADTVNTKFTKTTVTDAEAHATTYVTDDFARPVELVNAKSQTTKLAWDADNNVTYLEENNGAKAAFCYDQKTGYPLRQWDPETTSTWGTFNPTDYCDPAKYPGGATAMVYQTRADGYAANLWRRTTPLGNTWEFGYDTFGNPTSVTDPEGVATATAGDFTSTTAYDVYGQPLTDTDANGHTTHYAEYTPSGYPKRITDALDHSTWFAYDERGNTTESVNAQGAKVTQAYDYFGRPLAQTSPKDQAAGALITTPAPRYDANNNIVRAYAPNGAVTSSVYDAADRITDSLAPVDQTGDPERRTTTTYDKVGNVRTVTEPKGNLTATVGDYTTTYSYDEIYQPVSVVNARGDQVTSEYDDVGNLVTVVDPKKNATADTSDFTTKYTYDLDHRVVKTTDAKGEFTTVHYDLDGRTDRATDAEGNTTETAFDRRGLTTQVTVPYAKDASGTITYRTTRFEYDEVGNRTRVISPRGVATTDDTTDYTTETVYDELNRVKEQLTAFDKDDSRYATPDRTLYSYDAVGQLKEVSAPPSDGQSVRNVTSYEYYDNGWVRQARDPFDITTTYDYNLLGQQTKNTLTSAGGSSQRTMTWDFYPSGNQKARSDDGIPVGRQVVVVDSSDVHNTAEQGAWNTSQATEQWGYNVRTNGAGTGADTFTWQLVIPQDGTYEVFTRHGEVTGAATDAPFTVTHSTGSATRAVDQSANAGEWVSLGSYTFTESGTQKITLSDDANGTVIADGIKLVRSTTGETDNEKKDFTYAYDASGLLTEVKDLSPGARADAYTMAYDELNQLTKVEEKLGTTVKNTTSLTYDHNGNIDSTTHDVTWSAFEYDVRDMIDRITNADTPTAGNQQITTFTYTDRGQPLKQVKPNGNTVDYAYYLNGAVKRQIEKTGAGTVVASHDLEYDPNGNRTKDTAKVMNADNSADTLDTVSAFDYDPQDRIAKVTKTGDAAGTETYRYDGNSNIVEQTVKGVTTTSTYDRNRLLKTTASGVSSTYNYDPLGRLDTVSSNGSTQEKYTYDGFDRVARHTAGTGTSAKSTTYAYDAFDRTARETTSGTNGKTTVFTYLGMENKVLREEVAGKATKSYQYAPWGQKLTQIKHDADGTKEYSHYLYHPKGDVEAVTKPDGTTRATYGYTAYGSDDEGRFTGADKPDDSNPDKEAYNEYRYNAHRYDDGSGTYDMGFRNYDPGLNRFLTRDMYGGALADMSLATDPYTGNRYAFAGGNPISFVELDGHLFGMDISLSDIGHAALDVAGMVPVIGEAADVANGIWYAAEGNYADAALSMAAAVPGLGAAATAAKYAKKGAKAADAVKSGSKASKAKPKAKSSNSGSKKSGSSKSDAGQAAACPVQPQGDKPQSFVAGTRVVMGDGSAKPIEDLKVGDMVLATDPETGEAQVRPVTDTRNNKGDKDLVSLTVATGGKDGEAGRDDITSTSAHLYWLPDYGRWVEAGDIEPGTWLLTPDGDWVQVITVEDSSRDVRVYNLTVEGVHSYYVQADGTPLLVHNATPKKKCGKAKAGHTYRGGSRYKDLKDVDPATGKVKKTNVPGTEINHMPSNQSTPLAHGNGPSIQMDEFDHVQTSSWGRGAAVDWQKRQRALVNSGRIDQAMQMDIDDIVTRFPGKYNNAIGEMIGDLPNNADFQALRTVPTGVHVQLTLW